MAMNESEIRYLTPPTVEVKRRSTAVSRRTGSGM
jgi:hypothetical protein